MQGLEFMVTHDPSGNGTKLENSGVWVIRKQTRKKRQGTQDEVTPISSYYVVGINVYMAPSVGTIIKSRMVNLVQNGLEKDRLISCSSRPSHLSQSSSLRRPPYQLSLQHSVIPTLHLYLRIKHLAQAFNKSSRARRIPRFLDLPHLYPLHRRHQRAPKEPHLLI